MHRVCSAVARCRPPLRDLPSWRNGVITAQGTEINSVCPEQFWRRDTSHAGLRIVGMASVLRVDPHALRHASRAQSTVASTISTLAVGQSMASAGEGVSGLHSETGCSMVGDLFDAASSATHEELAAHADKLSKAADMYQRADKELGEKLSRHLR